ncbi:hypothetical protein Fmac_028933 [Flemingia macrophylla]|uniref:Mitochondrial import inner membrane translocase subunit TIM50 n=1 Tax=Flemingia macrophylla TaxID=520843 RepID=A0ABD1L8X7_9FABA
MVQCGELDNDNVKITAFDTNRAQLQVVSNVVDGRDVQHQLEVVLEEKARAKLAQRLVYIEIGHHLVEVFHLLLALSLMDIDFHSFCDGTCELTLANRTIISNISPEYGATVGSSLMDPHGKILSTESTVAVTDERKTNKKIVSASVINLSLEISKFSLIGTQVPCLKKRLIVLDINGLLVDVVSPPPKDCKADATIAGKAIFKRPFYLEFLDFCFEKFEVGIWSSRLKKNVDRVIGVLMGDMKRRLLFCWDLSHCTRTRFKTLENKHKVVVFKDLQKLWDKHDPNLPWEKGYYNQSNTLLLDDSPYKALLNPPNTSVFPHTFNFRVKNNNSLGKGGELRAYLDGLANTEYMAKYVEKHPFGQERISETSESLSFFRKVIDSLRTYA